MPIIERRSILSTIKCVKRALARLFPQYCLLCGLISCPNDYLCHDCKADLPWVALACERCGEALPVFDEEKLCGQCLKNPPLFQSCQTLWHYEAPINFFITQLKFQERLAMATMMGHYLAEELALFYRTRSLPKYIIPIPLH
ncbi:MAG: ComF family protein, partial [Legionellales bacterium]|nr:ComF family protein [Legionellales bacterium]